MDDSVGDKDRFQLNWNFMFTHFICFRMPERQWQWCRGWWRMRVQTHTPSVGGWCPPRWRLEDPCQESVTGSRIRRSLCTGRDTITEVWRHLMTRHDTMITTRWGPRRSRGRAWCRTSTRARASASSWSSPPSSSSSSSPPSSHASSGRREDRRWFNQTFFLHHEFICKSFNIG